MHVIPRAIEAALGGDAVRGLRRRLPDAGRHVPARLHPRHRSRRRARARARRAARRRGVGRLQSRQRASDVGARGHRAVERVTGRTVPHDVGAAARGRSGGALCRAATASRDELGWAPRLRGPRRRSSRRVALASSASARLRRRERGSMTPTARRPRRSAAVGRHAGLQRARDDRGDHPPRAGRAAAHRADRRRRRLDRRHARHPAGACSSELAFTLLLQPREQRQGRGAPARIRRTCTGDLVVIQDADLEYSPEEFPAADRADLPGRADVVYGSRFLGRHRVFLFTHYARQPAADAPHQRALQHDAHRHGDLLQGDADRGAAVDDARSRTASASSRS